MDQDDRVSRMDERGPENLARMGDAFVEAAQANFLDAEELVFGVEQDDTQGFTGQRPEVLRHELADDLRAVHLHLGKNFLGGAAAEFEGDSQPDGFVQGHPLDGGEFARFATCQRAQ